MLDHDDLLRFQLDAQSYVSRRGWRDEVAEDIASEMVVKAISLPIDHQFAMRYLYMQALDALDPRNRHLGTKVRQSKRTSHGVYHRAYTRDTSLDGLFHGVPEQGRERAMLLLYAVCGFDLYEIGWLFGLTEGSISKILRGVRDEVAGIPKSTRSHHAAR